MHLSDDLWTEHRNLGASEHPKTTVNLSFFFFWISAPDPRWFARLYLLSISYKRIIFPIVLNLEKHLCFDNRKEQVNVVGEMQGMEGKWKGQSEITEMHEIIFYAMKTKNISFRNRVSLVWF